MRNKLFSKRSKKGKGFGPFKTKIFFRTLLLAVMAVLCIYALYSFVFYGHFADFTVAVYQKLFRLDYDGALRLYHNTIRLYSGLIFAAAIAAVFFIAFRIYLNWFTNYFVEISTGMDSLIKENADDISLPSELLPIERKMNAAKHTIEKQKHDMAAAEQKKNDLIMYLAHDLKTPLASVIGYLSLLHDEVQIPQELREKYISISLGKAQRLEELINEFFEIARFHLSDIPLQYSTINLTRLLEQTVYEFGPVLEEKNLVCSLEIAQDVMLKCDADKIQRAFDNLLRNAVIYSFSNSEITIEACCREDQVTVRFLNHGNTIPKEKLERVFEQFYRLDAARGTESAGAGLGLAIVKQIVELHKGTITADSRDETIEFIVGLPVL